MLRRNSIEPGSVREIGCGAGEILRELAHKLGGQVTFEGYDISPQAFAICKRNQPTCNFTWSTC